MKRNYLEEHARNLDFLVELAYNRGFVEGRKSRDEQNEIGENKYEIQPETEGDSE